MTKEKAIKSIWAGRSHGQELLLTKNCATYSYTTFRITFSSSASVALSFSQGIAQVLGFLPNTTYTANSSFVITAPSTVNLSPNDTYFLTFPIVIRVVEALPFLSLLM